MPSTQIWHYYCYHNINNVIINCTLVRGEDILQVNVHHYFMASADRQITKTTVVSNCFCPMPVVLYCLLMASPSLASSFLFSRPPYIVPLTTITNIYFLPIICSIQFFMSLLDFIGLMFFCILNRTSSLLAT